MTTVEHLVAEGAFLVERLEEWENEHITEESCRDWAGHVVPSIERFKQLLRVLERMP